MVWPWQRNRNHRGGVSSTGVAPGPPRPVPSPGLEGSNQGRYSSSSPSEGPLSDPTFVAGLRPIPSGLDRTHPAWPASDIVGVSPTAASVEVHLDEFDQRVLLAFLTTRCDGCDEFWRGFRDADRTVLPESVSAAIVTKGPGAVAAAAIEEVAAGITLVPVIMSDEAWSDYRVSGYPFFVLVDAPTRTVVGETVGFGWSDVLSMIQAADR